MSSVFYRSPNHPYPRGARGEGVYLFDETGKAYLDGSGGAAVTCLGHGHPDIIAAVQQQVEKLSYAHTAFFTNEPQEKLAARLAERFGEIDALAQGQNDGASRERDALGLTGEVAEPDKGVVELAGIAEIWVDQRHVAAPECGKAAHLDAFDGRDRVCHAGDGAAICLDRHADAKC